jgi:DHA1 family inner membrane transport protein
MFAATAFLLPAFAAEFGISTSQTGWYSSIQVASFALASFGAGRFLRTSRSLLVSATTLFAVANFLSALAPGFGELLAMRVIAGLSAGTINWIAWAEAARRPAAMGKVAVIGPVAAAAGSVAFAPLLTTFGYRSVYFLLAGLGLVALAFPAEIAKGERVGRKVSDSRSNLVLLWAAAGLTLFGSAAFIYIGVKFEELGAATWVLSLAMTGNALAGILGTRFVARRAWPWLLGIAASVVAAVAIPNVWVSVAGLWAWGFAFWMAVPRLLRLLEERSDRPGERTGDAQGLMAIGRIAGPAVGGGLEAVGGFVLLGVVASAGIAGAAVATAGVERYRGRAD